MRLIICLAIRFFQVVSAALFRASIWFDSAVMFLRTRR